MAVRGWVHGSSVEESGGATHFALPQPGELTSYNDDSAPFNPPNFVAGTSNGSAAQPSPVRTKEYSDHLYATERPIRYRPGACAIYRRATFLATGAVLDRHSWTFVVLFSLSDAEYVRVLCLSHASHRYLGSGRLAPRNACSTWQGPVQPSPRLV